MIFDYVDIGTSFFHTSSEILQPGEYALMVEPVIQYLEKIPSAAGVVKANFAISNQRGFQDLFYVPLDQTVQYNLPWWIYGCNKLGAEHPTAAATLKELQLPNLMISVKVPTITFADLLHVYSIEKIRHLKIDTEGHDHVILNMVYQSLIQKLIPTIDSITFEYIDVFNNTKEIDEIVEWFTSSLGYCLGPLDEANNKTLTLGEK